MRIPDETLQEIARRVGIVSVVSEHVQLRKAGKNHVGLCPFHAERTPSFTVNEDKGLYHCFGCGAGGSVFTFVMKVRGVSFLGAVEELGRRAGVSLPAGVFSPAERRALEERDRLKGALEEAVRFYAAALERHPAAAAARTYLKDRGLQPETVRGWRLGFAPAGGEGLGAHLRARGIPTEVAERAGLLTPRRAEGAFGSDRFRGRVVFPVLDREGAAIGFGGRSLGGEEPKYLNSPETPLFHKGKTFYGLQAAPEGIRKEGRALVVEGYFDVLLLHQAGFTATAATLGTALTSEHLRTLSRLAPVVVLVFDPDAAGERAQHRALELALAEGVELRVVELPDRLDPDEFVERRGAEAFRSLVERAAPLLDTLLDRSRSKAGGSLAGGLAEARRWAGVLRLIQSPVERDLVLGRVASGLGVSESSLRQVLSGGPHSPASAPTGAAPRPGSAAERELLRLLVLHPEQRAEIGAAGGASLFREGPLRRAAAALLEGTLPLAALLAEVEDDALRGFLTSLAAAPPTDRADLPRLLEDCLKAIHLERLRERKQALMAEIKRARRGEEEGRVQALLKEANEVFRQERDLRGREGSA